MCCMHHNTTIIAPLIAVCPVVVTLKLYPGNTLEVSGPALLTHSATPWVRTSDHTNTMPVLLLGQIFLILIRFQTVPVRRYNNQTPLCYQLRMDYINSPPSGPTATGLANISAFTLLNLRLNLNIIVLLKHDTRIYAHSASLKHQKLYIRDSPPPGGVP